MNIAELLAALPEDDLTLTASAPWAEARLREILVDLAKRPVPMGSLHRLWTVSELSTQVALAYLAVWTRKWFSSAEDSKRRLLETNLRVALQLFHRLGYLRGAMTKLGQTAGHLPGLLPRQVAELLDRLHFDAPPMHFPLINEAVRNEFGKGAQDIFLDFETEAFAAASIGQVHRARLRSGEKVAVKIQYPGIARTIDADFRNLSALMLPMRLGKDWESVKAQFEEVRRMLNQEVDYLEEAECTGLARELFRAEDGIVIPRVYPEYSGKRVLTTEYVEGMHLEQYLATQPNQESRNAFGTKMYVAWQRMYYAFMPYADHHPGNYLFRADGSLGLIDFGCVQRYGSEERELMLLAEKMAFEDPSLTREAVRRVCGVTEDDPAWPDYLEMMEDALAWNIEPFNQSGPFDFGDAAYFQRGMNWFARTASKRTSRANPMYVYWNRSVFGIKALLYRLGAQVDVHQVILQERPR